MKIIWLCNIMLPIISKNEEKPTTNTGGWMSGLLNYLQKKNEVKLYILFPSAETLSGEIENIKYRSFQKQENNSKFFSDLIVEENPDIIHIFGSEHKHTLNMIEASEEQGYLDKTIICLQGIISECAKHFDIGLPKNILKKKTIRDLIKRDSIFNQMRDYKKRGLYEIQAIYKTKNVMGRTKYDYLCSKNINKDVNYYHCNETLRQIFYMKKWDFNKCNKHTIFVSQCNYPYKGFHIMIKALSEIKKKYPDVRLITTGRNLNYNNILNRARMTSYEIYLNKQIIAYGLQDNITFLGQLSESSMCEEYLKCNVFISPSLIENSSNSVGEAMLLGVPIVASYVGGIPSLLQDGVEGFLYPADDVTYLAASVCQIFENEDTAKELSVAARRRALKTHDPQKNTEDTFFIYKELYEKKVGQY